MTLPASRYYTADDLAWFSLDRYAQLAGFDFSQWRDLVRDRLHGQHVVDAALDKNSTLMPPWLRERWGMSPEELAGGDYDILQTLVTCIKENPLGNLDNQITLIGTEAPIATSTVRLMTGSYLERLCRQAQEAGLLGVEMEIDGGLQARQSELTSTERPPTFAHAVLNMHATDKQLTEDFKLWLAQWRSLVGGKFKNESYAKACEEWFQRKIVPYFDLKLLSKIDRKVIKDEDLAELLDLGDNETKRQKTLRSLTRWQKDLFCEETATMLTHLSFSDARSQLQEKSA